VSSEYIAGSCNIGKGEVRRRQSVALVGLFLVFFSASTILGTEQSRSLWQTWQHYQSSKWGG